MLVFDAYILDKEIPMYNFFGSPYENINDKNWIFDLANHAYLAMPMIVMPNLCLDSYSVKNWDKVSSLEKAE